MRSFFIKKCMLAVAIAAASVASALASTNPDDVFNHYSDIAEASYSDSLATAKALDGAIKSFIAKPSKEGFNKAKEAWLKARTFYQQTEVYRFGNAIVDDWEGRVNAWPLDEGLIDYVDASYGGESDQNHLYTANVIANKSLVVDGKKVDAAKIIPELLANSLHEAGGVEANVATGYHAIEFLLWGQDLNGVEAGSGVRPYTDFDTENCTNGHCDRRGQYLMAASQLLIDDLEEMVANWKEGGEARIVLSESGVKGGLSTILKGMGSLSYGELAGERMKLGLLLGDPEEEHDCFSDNTHNSHYYDALGVQNIYLGKYTREDGSLLTGPSISDLVKAENRELHNELDADLRKTMEAMKAMVNSAENGQAYDQMIASGNEKGNAIVQAAIDSLVKQTKSIERVIASLNLGVVEIEGSDSLDSPNEVFK